MGYDIDKIPAWLASKFRTAVTYVGSFSDEEKDLVLTAAMSDAAGRLALAQVMVAPIKVALEYQAIGRKLLQVDELPAEVLLWDMT